MNDEKCCGACRYHEHEEIDDGYVCVNDISEHLAEWTEYEDSCEEWKGTEANEENEENEKFKMTEWDFLCTVLNDYGIDVSRISEKVGKHIVEDFMEMCAVWYVKKADEEVKE